MGALALTGQPAKRAPFEPMPPGVEHAAVRRSRRPERAVDTDTAAVFLEPLIVAGGVVVPPEGYLAGLGRSPPNAGPCSCSTKCRPAIGRTGWFYAHQAVGIVPDVITLAKGLGGGCRSARASRPERPRTCRPGKHGTTFGGNPVCAAAALAVLQTIAEDDLISRADSLGKSMSAGIEALGNIR